MFSDPLQIPMDYTTDSLRNFARMPDKGDGKVRYTNRTAAQGHVRDITIAHQTVGKGDNLRDRHMVQMVIPAYDAEPLNTLLVGKPNSVCTLTFDLWRGDPWFTTNAGNLCLLLAPFLRGHYATAVAPDPTVYVHRLVCGES